MKLFRGMGNKLHISRACAGPNGYYQMFATEEEVDALDEAGRMCRRCRDYGTYGGHRP